MNCAAGVGCSARALFSLYMHTHIVITGTPLCSGGAAHVHVWHAAGDGFALYVKNHEVRFRYINHDYHKSCCSF